MSENNSEPFATAGSGKSDPEVAFDLLNKLKGQGIWGERNMQDILDMYAECLDAVKGLRAYEGQDRVVTPVRQGAAHKPAAPMSAARTIMQETAQAISPAPQPQMHGQAQVQTQAANPVQAQQAQIQQQLKRQA